jgi:autoinducer 2 (AI-2) kinase
MTNQEGYIIIDIGTGNVRVAVAAPSGEILSIERENFHYNKEEDYPDAAYFEPDLLWKQVQLLAKKALDKVKGIHILAVTATSQREGVVLIGKEGQSLIGLPNIDHRGRAWQDDIADKDEVYQLTGRYPGSLFSAMKIIGIRNTRIGIWDQLSSFMSISDWVEYKLSGVLHYEHSQASETLLYDIEKMDWSERLCTIFNIEPHLLPELKTSGTILGNILPAEAEGFGISADVYIIVGGADTQLAVMSTRPLANDIVIVSGTTTPVIKLTDTYITDPQQYLWTGRHTDGSSFIIEANAGVTGLNYQRLKEIFYPNEDYEVIEKELNELTHFQCMASLGSILAEEKSPLTRGGFVFDAPVSHTLTRANFVWAILWDIACSIHENYKSLCEVTGHDQDYIWACGGGVQSHALRQFIANLLGKKIIIRSSYRQASVIGGVFICNTALGTSQQEPVTLESVDPQKSGSHQEMYEEWKKTRAYFKQIVS